MHYALRITHYKLLPQLVQLFNFFRSFVAVEDVFRPFAVDVDKAAQLFVLDGELVNDLLGLAVDLKPRRLHIGRALLAGKIGKAHGVALAVIHGEVALRHVGAAELFGDRLADGDLCQLHRHVVKTGFEDKDLFLKAVEVGRDTFVDLAQVAVFGFQLLVTELKTLDARNKIDHEAVLHIIVENRVGEPRLIAACRTAPREQLSLQHLVAHVGVVGDIDARVDVRLAKLAAGRTDDRFVCLV